jgi:NADP-dependent 3-hydroxy acid dehydrogenase YdfG
MSSTTADNDTPLAGRTAVITGASRGIGLECARALSGAGARVVLVARSMDALRRACDELGPDAVAVECDLADPASVRSALSTIRTGLGIDPDIVVNNAGSFTLARVENTPVETFERTLQINLTSQFVLAREFVPGMRARRRGHIVTLGSIADHHAYPENAAYAASKFGARALHQVLREELRGSGVRATLVSPGPVDTTMWEELDPDTRPGFTPRAQMLHASSVAHAVRFAVTLPADVNIDEMRLSHT